MATIVIDLKELKETAEKATPGPWHDAGTSVDNFGNEYQGSLSFEWAPNGIKNGDGINENYEADAKFIALANPSIILSLIERVERAEEALTRIAARNYPAVETIYAHRAVIDYCREQASVALTQTPASNPMGSGE